MRLKKLTLYRLYLPMLSAFEHAAASRDTTDNIICELHFDDGTRGFGEAVARSYVTGETSELSWQLLSVSVAQQRRDFELRDASDALMVARAWAEGVPDRRGVVSNATRCALELALLDALFSKLKVSPVAALAQQIGLDAPPDNPNLRYSLVAGKGLLADEGKMHQFKRRYGYTAIKAKVGFGLAQDLDNLRRVRKVFGPDADIRVDANRAWTYDEAAAFLDAAKPIGIKTIEDPVKGAQLLEMLPELKRLKESTGCEIVLDEPVRTLPEAMLAIEQQVVDVISVRISKCGGLLRSMDIAALCITNGVQLQLGCQVGETAILSAAGRRFAEAIGNLRFLEGSNERLKFSPEHDLSAEEVMYGADSRGAALSAPGLGITVLRDRLTSLSSDIVEIDF